MWFLKAKICIWHHQLTWRMHHNPLVTRQEVILFYIQVHFYVIAIVFTQRTIKNKTRAQSIHCISSHPVTSFLLQNGGDGGTTAAQWSWRLIGIKGWASYGSKPQRWPSHSRYVIQTARFLVARCFRKIFFNSIAFCVFVLIKGKFKKLNMSWNVMHVMTNFSYSGNSLWMLHSIEAWTVRFMRFRCFRN